MRLISRSAEEEDMVAGVFGSLVKLGGLAGLLRTSCFRAASLWYFWAKIKLTSVLKDFSSRLLR